MVVICWMPNGTEIKEAWRIEQQVSIEHCLDMNRMFAQGGKAAVITVRCGELR